MIRYDAVVIGSGQAGNPLAQKLADRGWTVARIESERIFINTGTRPAIPSLEGLDRIDYLTNASLMELRELPAHLLVIGGGYVGLEFGQMFRRFGSDVTIVHRDDHILPREDTDV